ncbi:MAG: hypothetical protein ACJ8D7_19260, partial [Xanthobacteraceae bacterium]
MSRARESCAEHLPTVNDTGPVTGALLSAKSRTLIAELLLPPVTETVLLVPRLTVTLVGVAPSSAPAKIPELLPVPDPELTITMLPVPVEIETLPLRLSGRMP